MAKWNVEQYLKFQKERTQPSMDLAFRIPLESPGSILDLGCGPGNSTAVLRRRFPNARILGIDSSAQMIDAARKSDPTLSFAQRDAATELAGWTERFDIVFSNACLQWVPNHPQVLQNIKVLINPNGILAVQVPVNEEEPIHQILRRVSSSDRWRSECSCTRFFYTLSESEYFDLLAQNFSDFTMWQTTYCHRMPSHESILEWYRGTGMRPYLAVLSETDCSAFEAEVLQAVQEAYPVQKNGEILFRFPRLFFIAQKGKC